MTPLEQAIATAALEAGPSLVRLLVMTLGAPTVRQLLEAEERAALAAADAAADAKFGPRP